MSETKQYRKKPVVIEAMHYDPADDITVPSVRRKYNDFIGEVVEVSLADENHPVTGGVYWHIAIPTLEGRMLASPGDYIIKGVKGEFYPCKPDIFAATYEPAAPAPPASGEQQDVEAFAQQCWRIARNAHTTTDTGLLRAFRGVLDYYARSQVEPLRSILEHALRCGYLPESTAAEAERALRGGGR